MGDPHTGDSQAYQYTGSVRSKSSMDTIHEGACFHDMKIVSLTLPPIAAWDPTASPAYI